MGRIEPGRTSAVVFDLDGTLADSVPGIEASLRHALAQACASLELRDLRSAIGPPIKVMVMRLWPKLSEGEVDRIVAAFRAHYDIEGCRQARLYEGAAETLALLRERGLRLFLLTNKPAGATRTMLGRLGIDPFFAAVMSPDGDPSFSVKREGARCLQERFELPAESTVLVGDGPDDATAAQACGFGFIAAAYGYGRVLADENVEAAAVLKCLPDLHRILL